MSTDTRLITIDDYLAMILDGTIAADARVELLEGRLVEQMTKYPPHNFSSRQVGLLLKTIVPEHWLISEEKSLRLGPFWRPEPDLALIHGPNERYRTKDPDAKDVSIVIEVADSCYIIDRGEKWAVYAASRIPIYWIVNIQSRRVEVYREPTGRGKNASYQDAEIFEAGTQVSVMIGGHEVGRISVDAILP
jgi:hypothetical protein